MLNSKQLNMDHNYIRENLRTDFVIKQISLKPYSLYTSFKTIIMQTRASQLMIITKIQARIN